MHHHHHVNGAAQAFTKFGVITHHGTGLLVFWAAVLVLVLIGLTAARGNRRRQDYS